MSYHLVRTRTRRPSVRWAGLLCGTCLAILAGGGDLAAQVVGRPNHYQPLSQQTPPGVAGAWAGIVGKAAPYTLQPVRVEVPGGGQVTFFDGPHAAPIPVVAPALVRLSVGHLYRLRLSDMPNYPGLELYPTVELIDRLHPPPGEADRFPIPIQLTDEELEFAADGRLVTKVIYLEQPQLAAPFEYAGEIPVQTIPNSKNLLQEADHVGRPVAIIRLGGRLPDPHGRDRGFYGSGAPVQVVVQPAAN